MTPRFVVGFVASLALGGCGRPPRIEKSAAAVPAEPSVETTLDVPTPVEPPVVDEPDAPPEDPPPPKDSVTRRKDPGDSVQLPEPGGTTPVAETPPPGFTPIPAKRKKGFPGVAFAEVRAFAFDLHVSERPVCERPLDPDGTPCSTVVHPGVVLNEAQTKLLLGLFTKRSTWGGGAACFLPHHGFVFYDAAGVPVAELSVCFLCDMLKSAPAIPKAKRSGEGSQYGLGPKAVATLRGLCTELGLPKCDAKTPNDFGGS